MSTEVVIPPLGQTVDTVILVTWYKSEGDVVTEGEPLFAIETDKATLDVEAPASGELRQVSAQPDDEVKVLTPIALIASPGEALGTPQPAMTPGSTLREDVSLRAPNQTGTDEEDRKEGGRIFISPRARRLVEEHNVPLTALQATGPEGAIIERDVQAYLSSSPEAIATSEGTVVAASANEVAETIPLRGVRAVIAKRMLESATNTASVTLMSEADATRLVELRQQLGEDGVKVSYNDLLLYILARALRDHPRLNSSLEGEVIKTWQRIHIGLAVDTDRGLLVPVVRDVDCKRLSEIAEETQLLAERARAGKCTLDELTGGTFTLTNLGMFGIDMFTPIINLPECAILGVGRIKARPVVVEDAIVARQMVRLSLTFDHRVVDGAPAARFLQRVVRLMERPHLLIA